jgi:hypothetical protein
MLKRVLTLIVLVVAQPGCNINYGETSIPLKS